MLITVHNYVHQNGTIGDWYIHHIINLLIQAFCIVPYRSALFRIVRHRYTSFHITPLRFISFRIVPYRSVSFHIVAHRLALFRIVPHCSALFRIVPHRSTSFYIILYDQLVGVQCTIMTYPHNRPWTSVQLLINLNNKEVNSITRCCNHLFLLYSSVYSTINNHYYESTSIILHNHNL